VRILMRQVLQRFSAAPRAWMAGWAVWFVIAAAWVIILPRLSQVVTPNSLGFALLASALLLTLLMLAVLWLMRVVIQEPKRSLIVPLVALFLLLLTICVSSYLTGGADFDAYGAGSVASFPPVMLGVALFSVSVPALPLSVFFSEGGGVPVVAWHSILFFCLGLVTIVPVWIASLVKNGRKDQRRLVFGLFIGYWVYAVIGIVVVAAMGPAAFWG
jgi:hypothetical protein